MQVIQKIDWDINQLMKLKIILFFLKYFEKIYIIGEPKGEKENEENIDNKEGEKDNLHIEGFSYEQKDDEGDANSI